MRVLIISAALCAACFSKDRPNILLLFADDLGRHASAYADPQKPSPNDIISTPAFDRASRLVKNRR
jgi:uncharacterized sulfatase